MALSFEKNPDPLYPEDILNSGCNGECWWVAHTKSRREKTLASFLASKGVGYYLPLVKKRQPSNRRERFSFLPLFPGYLFFKGNRDDRYSVYSSNQIARVIEVKNQDLLLKELTRTRQVLSINMPVYPYDFLAEGQRVSVKYGPMKGLEGIVLRKKSSYRLVLNVTTISQAIAVDIEADMVEAI